MGLEDLADVHPAGHAQRIEHDIHVRAVFQIGHVLDRQNLGDNPLVAVTAGHLVAGLQLALHRHEHLDHLHHAGRQFVAPLQLVDLVFEAAIEALTRLVELTAHGLQLAHRLLVFEGDLPPHAGRDFLKLVGLDLAATQALGPGDRDLAHQEGAQTRGHVAVQDREFVVPVLAQAVDFRPFNGQGAFVLVDAVPVEHPDLDDRSGDARRQAQGGVADVRRLFTEDGAQQFFFRGHRAFALWRDLAHQDVARQDLGPDRDNARLVEVAQRFLADIGNVPGDLFRAQLGVAGHDLELLDVDRGEDVVAHDPFRDQDRVFKVVSVPRHEGDEGVAPQGQFTELGRGTVGDHVAGLHLVAHAHQRTLIDAGRGVGALELLQAIDVDARLGGVGLFRRPHDDAGAVDLFDNTGTAGHHDSAGIHRHHGFHTGADQRRVRLDQRHGLLLHVRTHEGAIGVIVLEERNQRRGHRDHLLGRNVHQVHVGLGQ